MLIYCNIRPPLVSVPHFILCTTRSLLTSWAVLWHNGTVWHYHEEGAGVPEQTGKPLCLHIQSKSLLGVDREMKTDKTNTHIVRCLRGEQVVTSS